MKWWYERLLLRTHSISSSSQTIQKLLKPTSALTIRPKKKLRKMFNFPFWKIPFQLLEELESQPSSSYKVRKLGKLKYWERMFGEVCGNFTHSFKWENETYVFDHELECTVSKTVFVLFTLIGLAGLFGNSLVVLGE